MDSSNESTRGYRCRKADILYEVSLGDFSGEYENIRKLRASRTRTLDDDGLLVHSEEWKTVLRHILLQFVKERCTLVDPVQFMELPLASQTILNFIY